MIILNKATALLLFFFFMACTDDTQTAYNGYDRDTWQKPEEVIHKLNIQSGDFVADLGAGGGYFTFRLADAAGDRGRVYAVEVDRDLTTFLQKKAYSKHPNVKTVLATFKDSKLPAQSVDLVFCSNSYRHIENRIAYFEKLKSKFKPGGRLAIIELKHKGLTGGIDHTIAKEEIIKELQNAGYTLENDYGFLERQNFLIFTIVQP